MVTGPLFSRLSDRAATSKSNAKGIVVSEATPAAVQTEIPAAEPSVVVAYDPTWPALFQTLATDLRQALGAVAVRIDHIGSTAVPGLAAKPVIDIQISVAAFEPENAFRVTLEGLGYRFRADNPERTKRYFRESPGARRTHIHVRRRGS
jgi:GrpB-like predicted nucleotidyltransferase (UPF0157 family)